MLKFRKYLSLWLLLPSIGHASIIESTMGTAVVNDATATYFNPAALTLLKNSQIIPLGTVAYYHSRFSGQTTFVPNGFTETGSTSTETKYFSPSFYVGVPATENITLGLAVISNSANRSAEDNSVLRYVESSNSVQDFDVVPAIGIKVNKYFSVGAGINFSYADFDLQPILGFPGSNIADSQSRNQADGTGMGFDVGLLLKPAPATLIGFNYRSSTTYHLSGKSVFTGAAQVVSDNYHFDFWSPARSVLSINRFVTPKLGFLATIQRIQWSVLKNINIHGIATLAGTQPVILNATVPYILRDTCALTLGSQYWITPKWIARLAATYNQSPGDGDTQISNGDSIIVGVTTGYDINKTITIDAGYAHAFIKNENINISGNRYLINGVNQGSRDSVSLKLTFNV